MRCDYKCMLCGKTREGEVGKPPRCYHRDTNTEHTMTRIFRGMNFILKGSGYYSKDNQ